MKFFALIFTLLPGVVMATETVGFSQGNTRTAVAISGDLMVSCHEPGRPPTHAFFSCRDLVLEPTSYDFFQGPKGLDADEVELTATREDGSTRTKREKYDSLTYRSEDPFNLWISTLFQRPLLKGGHNEIAYTLIQNQTAVGQGKFQVLVQKGPSRVCPRSSYNSINSSDCQSQFSVCNRYFSQYNNCRL